LLVTVIIRQLQAKMLKIIEQLKEGLPSDCFSDTELINLLSGSKDRRYGLVKRAFASGELIHLKKKLYCIAEKYRKKALNLFEIAQRLYGPSYISLESALSYHGWIPEAVYTTTSACMNRSKFFNTPIGVFSFSHVSASVFFAMVDRIVLGNDCFFMARPWRAIADYIQVYKKDWKGINALTENLRIEEDLIRQANLDELDETECFYKSVRVSAFFKSLKKEIKK